MSLARAPLGGDGSIYLDWNATAPPLLAALEAQRSAAAVAWANPASPHRSGRRARALVESARSEIGAALGAQSRDLILVSGGTEANNLALRGVPGLVTSRLEHPSITRVAESLVTSGVPVVWLPTGQDGQLDPSSLSAALGQLPRGSLVAVGWVNHETGVIQPVAELACRAWDHGARLHLDAVQGFGKLPGSPLEHADSVALAAHKLGGPKGIGALAWRPGAAPRPLLLGGGQERGLRPGTVAAGLAAGFAVAVRTAADGGPRRYRRLASLRDRLESALSGSALVNGAEAPRAAHVTNLSFVGWRGDELVAALDLEGLEVASGSACSAGTTEASTVIEAMVGRERARSAVRFSLGETTSESEIERAIEVLGRVLARAGCTDLAGRPSTVT